MCASVVVTCGLTFSEACGILQKQGSNLCPLYWQANSYPLHHQGSPKLTVFTLIYKSANSNKFPLLDSKIIVDGDCSHEIRRRLLLGRKTMTNLDSVLKSRDITLPAKVRIVKVMVLWSCMVVRVEP